MNKRIAAGHSEVIMTQEVLALVIANSKIKGMEVIAALKEKFPKYELNESSCLSCYAKVRSKLGITKGRSQRLCSVSAESVKAFRIAKPNTRLDLSATDMRGFDLGHVNLERCNLQGANAGSANLRGANLSYADLSGAFLLGSNLEKANLGNADLSHADMEMVELRGADLSRANLLGALLRHANLTDVNLTHANLGDADLSNACLTNANLTAALLGAAKLIRADLRNADLKGTVLLEANLTAADLCNADLHDAELGRTVFISNDLAHVLNLESVIHSAPSPIDVSTLQISKGKIPQIFLRGCGFSEEFITHLPSLVGREIDFYSCFISHNKADKQFARQLHDRLQGRGIRCWLDEHQLKPGDDLYDGIDRGIRVWDKVLLCASKDSLASSWVDDEITIALEKEKELLKSTQKKLLKIIPLDLDGFMFSDEWQSGYRAMIRKRVAADFTKWKTDADEFERQFERVVKALRTDGGKLPEPPSKLK